MPKELNLLDDKNLINKLLKAALDFESKFTKSGQDASVNKEQQSTIVRSMLDSLEQELSSNDLGKVSYEGFVAKEPELDVNNLIDLGSLVDFLSLNKITVGGQRIAYDEMENPNNEAYSLYRLEHEAGLNEDLSRQPQKLGHYVNKDLLDKYLVSLQASMQKTPNPVLQAHLNQIIKQAKTLLGSKINEKYTPPVAEEKVLPDETVLDYLLQTLNPVLASQALEGHIPLTFGNVKTPEAVNAWLIKNDINLRSGEKSLTIKDPDFDHCAVFNVFAKRAEYLANRATNAEIKSNANVYLKQSYKLAASIPNCRIGAGASNDQTTQLAGKVKETGTGTGKVDTQLLLFLAKMEVFTVQNIDFNAIQNFLEKFSTADSSMDNQKVAAEQAMSNATASSDNNLRIFPMLNSYDQMFDLAKAPEQANISPMLAGLLRTYQAAGTAYQYFITKYGATIRRADSDAYDNMYGQFMGTSSAYKTNLDKLGHLRQTATSRASQSYKG